jgi:hypothetical protein
MPRVKRPRPTKKNLTCTICHKTCDDLRSLHRHMKTHAGIKPWYCEACGNTYSKKHTFQSHRCYPEHCNICDKKFRTDKDLKVHTKECHIGPWKCLSQGCNADKFMDQLSLRDHLLDKHVEFVETCPKPYRCKVKKDDKEHRCVQWFTTKSALNRHISTLAGYKPYACTICSRKYLQKWKVTAHMKSVHGHEEFTWKCCDMLFKSKQKFTDHMRFSCPTKGQHARSSRRVFKVEKEKKRASKTRVKGKSRSRRSQSAAIPGIYKEIALHYQECLRCHRFGEQRFELVLCNKCKQGFHHSCITKGHKAPLTFQDLFTWKCFQCKDIENNSLTSLKNSFIPKVKLEKGLKNERKIVSLDDATSPKLQAIVSSCNTSIGKECKPRKKFLSVVDIGVKKPPQVLVRDIVSKTNLCTRY